MELSVGHEDINGLSKEAILTENMKLREELKVLQVRFEEISRGEFLLKRVWDNNPAGIFVETLDGEILDCNPVGCRMFGYSLDDIRCRTVSDLICDEMSVHKSVRGGYGETSDVPLDRQAVRSDGVLFTIHVYSSVVTAGGEPLRIVYVRDISDVKEVEEELRFQAYTDGLTGIWNRSFFQRRLLEEMERVRRYGAALSLIMFDIDNFKDFNDLYGHVCGDKALKTLAEVVRKSIRASDCFCRWGGDEFLLFSPVPEVGAMAFAERLRREVREVKWPRDMRITLSMGVAEFRKDTSAEIFMEQVDQAMYRAKRSGGDRVCAWAVFPTPDEGGFHRGVASRR